MADARSETFETVNPATGRVITSIASCGAEDVDEAVKAARRHLIVASGAT
ncbi:MAG: aldehyde dehydrogenase family protein [[Clostridium] scindens]